MIEMRNSSRRRLLQTGFLLLAGFGLPVHSYGYADRSGALLQSLSRHRWIPLPLSKGEENQNVPAYPYGATPVSSPAVFWIEKNLELVKKYQLNPLRAARALSYLSASMHDAVLSSTEKYGDSRAHYSAVLHLTAAAVIEYFFPEEIKGRWPGQGLILAAAHAEQASADGAGLWKLSQEIAQQTISRALTDGSARINAMAQPPKNMALTWKGAPPLWATRPAEPGAPGWRPWLVPPSVGDACPPPSTLNEPQYLKEVLEVYRTHQQLSDAQKKMAESWNLELGTVSPPGVWLLKAIEKPAFQKFSLLEQTSALSLLTTTMMDAFTACWHVKFKWWTERPITAIHRLYDPKFSPHIVTPSFPSYVSGHATVSGAAASILAALLPQHRDEWMAAADEAALSRLYGGIHFRSDNEEGLALGKKVAAEAIAKIFQQSPA